jgi:hypothetical protein
LLATGDGAYRIDPATGALTDLGVGRALWITHDGAGRTAAVLDNGEVRIDGRSVGTVEVGSAFDEPQVFSFGDFTMGGITGLAVDDSGTVWVSSTLQGVVRVVPGGTVEVVDPGPAWSLIPTVAGMLWSSGDPQRSQPIVTRGIIDGQVAEIIAHPISAIDPTGVAIGWTTPTDKTDPTTMSWMMRLKPT